MIEISQLVKTYQALRPLRIAALKVDAADRLALSGFDAGAAEMMVNLITGAALPDTGDVRVEGRNTRDIATDTEWLASLDRFGVVTERAVLLESLSVSANMALPFTLAIEPIAEDVIARVASLGADVGLDPGRLGAPASTLSPSERVRVHLARAMGPGPQIVLLEHPTRRLDAEGAEAFGQTLRRLADARGFGWLAMTEDDRFARASGARRLRLDPATGRLSDGGFWRRILHHD